MTVRVTLADGATMVFNDREHVWKFDGEYPHVRAVQSLAKHLHPGAWLVLGTRLFKPSSCGGGYYTYCMAQVESVVPMNVEVDNA